MPAILTADISAARQRAATATVGQRPLPRHNLNFPAAPRPVRTASATQVRQPIYRTSIGRWRPYTAMLRPLFEALGPELGVQS